MDQQEKLAKLSALKTRATAINGDASRLLNRLSRRIEDNADAVRDRDANASEAIRRECHAIIDDILDSQIQIGEILQEARHV